MHEFSVAASLLTFCAREQEKQGAGDIKTIYLQIGAMSGIEIQLLRQAFDALKEKSGFARAVLAVKVEEIAVHCDSCGQTSGLSTPLFSCPLCESEQVMISGGDKMVIEKIDFIRQG